MATPVEAPESPSFYGLAGGDVYRDISAREHTNECTGLLIWTARGPLVLASTRAYDVFRTTLGHASSRHFPNPGCGDVQQRLIRSRCFCVELGRFHGSIRGPSQLEGV